mgnify:CR=1 FL=1
MDGNYHNEEVLLAAMNVVQAWDRKEYLKEPIEVLRKHLKKLMDAMWLNTCGNIVKVWKKRTFK